MRFRSKVDRWFIVVMAASAVVVVLAAADLIARGRNDELGVIFIMLLLIVVFPAWLLVSTHYTFEGDDLVVRSGPLRWRVPLREVHGVTPSRSILSSPALSLDRLRIDYGQGRKILISPADKEGFLREMERRRGRG